MFSAYDHEHGSSPKHIFGYEPKFDYGAFKNNRQNEPNRGFKGFVFSQGPYWVYYSLHVITSDLLRVTLRLHTITLVVASKSTGEILVDLTQKGDFGFQSVRLADGRSFRPLTPDDVAIQQELASGTLMFRSMNVIDANNLNRDFSFRNPLMLGQYEEWQTLPMCTRSNRKKKAVQSTFKTPGTGIKSLTETSTRVDLGRMVNGAFYKSTGLFRTLRLPKLTVAASLCPGGASGEFYTDPSGKTVVSGPGPTHVRQYVQPGFSAVFSGKYEPVDQWIGLHSRGARGFFVDHGYGIDPDLN